MLRNSSMTSVATVCASAGRSRGRPQGWFNHSLSGADLIVMGTQFQQCAAITMDPDLARTFADAALALLEAGAARLY
jgi:hypothetical protein